MNAIFHCTQIKFHTLVAMANVLAAAHVIVSLRAVNIFPFLCLVDINDNLIIFIAPVASGKMSKTKILLIASLHLKCNDD